MSNDEKARRRVKTPLILPGLSMFIIEADARMQLEVIEIKL